jgi:hypothetical protein
MERAEQPPESTLTELQARLGLVPKQCSTDGKPLRGRIIKHGNVYLRTLLIHGVRSVLYTESTQPWDYMNPELPKFAKMPQR